MEKCEATQEHPLNPTVPAPAAHLRQVGELRGSASNLFTKHKQRAWFRSLVAIKGGISLLSSRLAA